MSKMQISLVIGLFLIGNGRCQLFESPEISNEDDLMATPTTYFGPKTLGFTTTNLGPLNYGSIGGVRVGSIGPLHYGYIGGMYTDPFLRAPNPNAEDQEFPDTTADENIVGNPMEQNWQELNDETNFVGMEPNEEEMLELGPQMPENARAFLHDGLFGVNKRNKFDKFGKIPSKHRPPIFISPSHYPHYSGSYSGSHDGYGNHVHGQVHDNAYRRYDSHKRGYGSHGYASHGYASHGNSHGYGHGNSHGYSSHGYDSHGNNHRYGSHGYGHKINHRIDFDDSHKHVYSHGGHRHGNTYDSNHGNAHSQTNIYELSHGVPADVYQAIYKKYGSHSHGLHGSQSHISHKELHKSKFRSNDEMDELEEMEDTMLPNNYEFDQPESEDMNQSPIFR